MSGPRKIALPGVPPGEGAIGGSWSREAVREAIAPWHRRLVDALDGEELPARVDAKVTLAFSDRRKRNVENWRAPVQRLVADALGDRLAQVEVEIGRRRKNPATIVELTAAGGSA